MDFTHVLLLSILTTLLPIPTAGRHHGLPLPINLLRPTTGSDHHPINGLSCESWRFAVETNNKRDWKVPGECERVGTFNPKLFNEWVIKGVAPALPESLKLYYKLVSLGIKVVFLTGRGEDKRNATTVNLKKQGYHSWKKLLLKPTNSGTSAVSFKSSERRKLADEGYRIVGNIGDQWSDILGSPQGERTFKLPDPMYYIS
ncbi:uncharacterized protein A4U43_C06F12000 [Asparagus officinalis]|uniref:Acid phosphatase n=1 Tax=Asparagus officinalis TaxID=4686 RepID=A0A5P1EQF4_ASPOF|nr:uncharacterized protein A4U43_C06F12000 [Asparagus officinalis]